jgi:hypothetical protein
MSNPIDVAYEALDMWFDKIKASGPPFDRLMMVARREDAPNMLLIVGNDDMEALIKAMAGARERGIVADVTPAGKPRREWTCD